MRVCIAPTFAGPDKADGGIRRVIEAMGRSLPDYDIQIVDNPHAADVVNVHGTLVCDVPGVPVVSSCHGMYWHEYDWAQWAYDANRRVIESLTRAQAITAPSRWVAGAISRGMLAKPTVIYHGVDADEWATNEDALGYVLWNKARADAVSDPAIVNRLADLLPDVPILSTFGQSAQNVRLLGAVTYDQMRPIVQHAGVYLATARETMGIGTLEALAAGVPIAGWRYGGQEEIVIEGETGYLVPYGDDAALAEAVRRCLAERKRLSANAREDARSRWGWGDKIAQYAALFRQVADDWNRPRPKVSVVVTCYNLGRFLEDAIGSVVQQTMTDWECVVVDDCSTDDSWEVVELYKPHKNVRYLKTPRNLGLSGARNYGWQHARGRYILFLDADDMLAPNALEQLSTALNADPSIHIAYGHLDTTGDDGTARQRNPWPPGAFDWRDQLSHLNQLPYAAMVRREVLERSGGYRLRDWRAEDASLWCRLTSFGFRATKVTQDSTLIYRIRSDSKSGQERSQHEDADGDWTAWYPWRLAGSAAEGVQAKKEGRQPNPLLVPWGAQGTPAKPAIVWPVRHHQHPAVSVIIPVGPDHAPYVIDALDSLIAQTCPDWEAIVVNDTGEPLPLPGHPWARVINLLHGVLTGPPPKPAFTATGPKGAGHARNTGVQFARAPLCLFLDADDLLLPGALETMLRAFVQHEGRRYIYSDWLRLDGTHWDGPYIVHDDVPEYDPHLWLEGQRHPMTILIPTEAVKHVGGFDEDLQAWEDWDFLIKCAVNGICGALVAQPLMIYRTQLGTRRTTVAGKPAKEQELYTQIRARYAAYIEGETPMAGCCSSNVPAWQGAQQALDDMQPPMVLSSGTQVRVQSSGVVRMRFIGDTWGARTFFGKVSNQPYQGGANPHDQYTDMDPRDVESAVNSGLWAVVNLPVETVL